MDGGAGFLESITSWFTPTIFFCLFNLTVATIFIQSSLKPKTNNEEQLTRPDSEENDSVHFFKFPKLLERVKSINLSRSYFSEPEPVQQHEEPVLQHEEPVLEEREDEVVHVERTKSETIVVKRVGVKKMKKSQSAKIMRVEAVEEEAVEKWRPATVRERKGGVIGEDEAVDAKADDFINRFKQQLKLQRLDSLLRFRGASN